MEKENTIKNFSYVGIGRVATIVLNALFYLLLANLLDPEIYGDLNVILALAGAFSIFSMFGLNLSLQVFKAKKNSKLSEQIITLFIISTTGASLILLVIDPIAALLCIGLSFFSMARAHLLGLKDYKNYMIYSILKSGAFFIIPLLLFFVYDIPGIVVGMAISNFIGSIPFLKNLTLKSFFGMRKYTKVLIHNFGVSAGGALPNVLDKLMIAPLFGLYFVGIHQFNLQIFIALSVLPQILGTYLISEESSGVGHRKLSIIVILGSILLSTLAIILAPTVVPYFFPKYIEGIPALQILVLSIIPYSIGTVYGSKLIAKESTKVGFIAILRIGSLLLFIAVLGNIYGIFGLGLAVLFSIILATIFTIILYKKSIIK